jgi:hypothetical protein
MPANAANGTSEMFLTILHCSCEQSSLSKLLQMLNGNLSPTDDNTLLQISPTILSGDLTMWWAWTCVQHIRLAPARSSSLVECPSHASSKDLACAREHLIQMALPAGRIPSLPRRSKDPASCSDRRPAGPRATLKSCSGP